MNASEESKPWSNLQAYGFALVCLLVGYAVGYLLHPRKPALANAPQTAIRAMNGMPSSMPSPEQLKQMADKQLEPMLAALQKDPSNPDLLAQIATVYLHTQQFAAAVDYYGRAVKVKPTADGYVKLGGAYLRAGSPDQTLDALNHALQLDPKSADALFNLGMLKWRVKNDPKGAVDAWQRLIKANPNFPRRAEVEQMIAQAKQHMNMPAGAKTDKPPM
jgi:cytochrome c-type biogenesis protein CcmH/NrfG